MNEHAYPRYPRYKDSGVEWLGEIPQHWNLRKLKWLAPLDIRKGADEDAARPYVGLENVQSWTGRYVPAAAAEQATGESVLFDQDHVLFGKLRPYLAKALKPTFVGRCTGEFLVLSPREVSRSYLHACFLSASFVQTVNSSTFGTKMPRADWRFVGSVSFPVPPPAEQKAIASFLDRETAKIDALIEKQTALITALNERKAALINHTVTKGIDDGVQLKDSGIEWLGQVPEHWQIERARWLFRQLSLPPGDEDGVVTAFRNGQVTLRENRRTEGFTFAFKEAGYQHVREGDLVIHSMDAFAGAIGVSESDGKCTGEYVVCDPRVAGLSNTYYALLLRQMAIHDYIRVVCPAVRQRAPRFRFVRLKDVLLPVPPPEEQDAIVSFLTAEIARIDGIVTKAQGLIDRMKEKRAAIISAAVTGKIDIRGVA